MRDSIQARSISGGNFAPLVGSHDCCYLVSSVWRGRDAAEPAGFQRFRSSAASAQTVVAPTPQGPQLQPAGANLSPTEKTADIPSLQPSSLQLSLHPVSQPRLQFSLEPLSLPLSASATETYTAKRGESIPAIAHQYLQRTGYLTSSELAEAIRHINGNRSSNILKNGEQITIPGILPAPIVEKTVPVPKDFEVRAIYLTGIMAASDHGLRIIRHWREVGGNAVVFDIKDSDGSVTIPFEHPLLGKHQVYIHDLPKFVHFLHSENMHAIARIAIFRDERMVVEHPELAVQSKKNEAAVARERQAGLDRLLQPQGSGLQHRASQVRSAIRRR